MKQSKSFLNALKDILPGYEARPSQEEMMEIVDSAFAKEEIALIEAGTGTGKSLAYLLPGALFALSKNEKVVISTHTIALQEQLLTKDIPLTKKALKSSFKACLVKGMGNYLCLRKVAELSENAFSLNEEERECIDKLTHFTSGKIEGSRSSLPFRIKPDLWEEVAAESDTCTGRKCPHFSNCFFFKARKETEDAHLIIVNHHLFFSDLQWREAMGNFEGDALLPAYSRVILDEAHHIETVASQLFSGRVNQLFLLKNLGRLFSEKDKNAKLSLLKSKLLQSSFQESASLISRLTLEIPGLRRELQIALFEAFQSFEFFLGLIKTNDLKLRLQPFHTEHPFWKDEIHPKVLTLISELKRFCETITQMEKALKESAPDPLVEVTKALRGDILSLNTRILGQAILLEGFIEPIFSKDQVKWIEIVRSKSLTPHIELVKAYVTVDEKLKENLFKKIKTAILCSATLTGHKQFDHLKSKLGLQDRESLQKEVIEKTLPSPFDFENQALFIVPKDLSPPDSPAFIQEAKETIIDALKASRGRAFVLFTSFQMLDLCYGLISKALEGKSFSLLKQGNASIPTLIQAFRTQKQAVLFGTSSFWEGIDIIGDALKLVILVKLPFQVPSDPLAEAKAESLLQQGKSPFFDLALPEAVCRFKQGFGRLIRHHQDRGCVICLDQRLITKPYGKLLLKALPPCKKEFIEKQNLLGRLRAFYNTRN